MTMLRTLLHRPIAVTMVLIAIVTLGVLALGRIPVSLMPDIDVPRIVVQMPAQGVSAREIEQSLVSPMRQQLSQVTGLKDIESVSRTDAGVITLTFSPGSRMSLLFIEVNEKIDRVMGTMPKDVSRPKVMKTGALDIPAFYIDVTGGKAEQTSRLVSNVISKRIEQLPEVAMVDCSGMVGAQITIRPDAARLAALGLTNDDIDKAIVSNNIVLEALSVRDGICRYSIHFDSQILSVRDIEDIYIQHDGRLLQLKDVCTVEEEAAERKGIVFSDGNTAVTMAVIKQSDAQMSDLQESIGGLLEQLEKDYPDLHFAVTRDQTQLLSYSMHNLEWNLLLGIVMAAVVLFVFIGGWRLPLLVAVSIPLALILTLLCFYLMGISLNIISLSGLILGVGMIVDNAIIVTDNIRQKGAGTDRSIAGAVKEVFMPMLSSVLTTCSVFVPLIFLSGTAGALFYDQAMGVSIALFCSLAVAASVVPVYYFMLCRKVPAGMTPESGRPAAEGGKRLREPAINAIITRYYEAALRYTLRHGKTVAVGFGGCVLLIALLFPFIRKERMPVTPHADALVRVDWNAAIVPEENARRMKEVLAQAGSHIEASTLMVGSQDFMLSHTPDITGSEAVCYIRCGSAEECDEAVAGMAAYIAGRYHGAKVEQQAAANIFDMIFSTDEPALQIRLQKRDGGRPEVSVTRALTDSLRRRFPHSGIQPVPTETYISYRTDAERMAFYKVTYRQLYQRLRELLGTGSIYDISSGGESIPVVIGSDGKDVTWLSAGTIANADGTDIPLSYLLTETRSEYYKHLAASDDGEFVQVSVARASDAEVEAVMDYVRSLTDDSPVKASFHGGYFSSRAMIGELAVVMCVAVLLLYFILAAQFESVVQPVIILIEIVIDVALVMLALFVCGESLNIMSMTGMVVMCGIIINDSILKVDTINRLYRQRIAGGGVSGVTAGDGGDSPAGDTVAAEGGARRKALLRAIVVAGHSRLKPIVMTSLTTILAIVPFLQRGDMGSALQFPLSFAIIVGMLAGTFVSLFFVPLMYYIIYRKR